MFRSYLKTAWRRLFRNKTSAFINIGGLTIGMAVAWLIGLWIYDELSYNTYHQNYSRIAQVMTRGVDPKDGPFINNSLQYPLAAELQTNYKDNFSHIIRASWEQDNILAAGDKKLSVKGLFMDAGAPEMLTLKMLKGNWNALNDPYSVMLSSSLAKALFGNADPMGKTVTISNKTSVKVTGVYEDLPMNTQFRNLKFLSTWKLWVSENAWIAVLK